MNLLLMLGPEYDPEDKSTRMNTKENGLPSDSSRCSP